MKNTPQQDSFLETAQDQESIALRARAGTGKTFSLRAWASKSSRAGIATSFSKATVTELAEKLGGKFPAKTFHALGLAALKGNGQTAKLDTSKIFNIVKALSQENDIPFESQGEIRDLATMAKVYGINPDPTGPEGITPNADLIWEELATQYDIEFSPEILHWSKITVNMSNLAFQKGGSIDFDDMLYCALIFPHKFAKVPIILADEVQDFNLLQHTMLKRCLLPNGRVIAAGDDRQAIYGFRGALSNSYTELVSSFKMKELPLTVSFRCPKEVVLAAQQYVPDIEYAPDAMQGSVLYPSTLSLSDVPKTVLCRNNAPLMRLALRLLVSGRTVEIAGRDIGQNLIKLTERITRKNLSREEFLDKLEKWKDKEIIKYPRRKFSITEKALVLKVLASAHKDLAAVQAHLGKLYPDPKSKQYRPADVHLSTIHKAKGLEWPNVLFLDSHLIGKHATSDWEQQQENNLAYVGITRAQKELTFIASQQIEGLED
jgi:DNA helicase-2/ATP-dependent DNA helicase PcrA